jgi:ubiquinone/menaquinone biosynthesis C-methylase UbiE
MTLVHVDKEPVMAEHVCPVWVGYLLASPLRKLVQNPDKILEPYVSAGMVALDVGCAMGFFSLSLARLVGENGKVICVDLQDKMIEALGRRARKTGLASRIETRVCSRDSLGVEDLAGQVDFALALAVVHEVPDPPALFGQVCNVLKPGAKFLVSEPKGHVSSEAFEESVAAAVANGFEVADRPKISRSRAVLLAKELAETG